MKLVSGGEGSDKRGRFKGAYMEDIGKHLDRSKEAWDTAHKRLSSGRGNLVRRTEELKQLGAKTKKSLPEQTLLEAAELEQLQDSKVSKEK